MTLFLGPWLCLAAVVTKPDVRAPSARLGVQGRTRLPGPGHRQQLSCQRSQQRLCLPSFRAGLTRLEAGHPGSGCAGGTHQCTDWPWPAVFFKRKKEKKKEGILVFLPEHPLPGVELLLP